MTAADCVIALDIGGTQVKGYRFENGQVVGSAAFDTDASLGLGGITAAINRTIRALWTDEVAGIGIASAGTIDAVRGKVLYATPNLPGFGGFDPAGAVGRTFGVPCVAINDAQAALLGELRFGNVGAGGRIAMLTFGTGVGGAFAVDGKIDFGAFFTGHAYGHYTLYENGKQCNCGCLGCVERYVSGTALHERLRENGIEETDFNAVEAAYESGDPAVKRVMEAFADDLAKTVNKIAVADAADVVIIGGGVADRCPSSIKLAAGKCRVPIVPATLKNAAGIYGAYAYLLQRSCDPEERLCKRQ